MTEIPPPPPPAAPAGGSSAAPKNWLGLVALIAGIVGLVLNCCYGSGFLLSVGAIVLGVLGKKAVQAGEANNGSQAQWGFILGIVGIVIAALAWILAIVGIGLSSINSY